MATLPFYKEAAKYWANMPATIDGVLGSFGYISDIDINGSNTFLEKVFALKNPPGTKLALDCGAGIGRVSKQLLMQRFDKVDLIEQDEKFIKAAKQSISEDNAKLGTLYQIGLQNFEFEDSKSYDVIWCQWVLGHLDDFDLISFLKKCKYALADNGVIIIKENITSSNDLEYDEDDSSVTRPLPYMMEIFHNADLKLVLEDIQAGFPEDIYPVHSFLLVPLEPIGKFSDDVQDIDRFMVAVQKHIPE